MADVPAPSTPVTEDVPCRRCGYNLRTLAMDAKCPECGTAVADSLRGNFLRDADPEWLKKIGFGVGLKLWNIVLVIFVNFAAGFLAAMGTLRPPFVLVALIGCAIGLWATFVITTQEPRSALQDDPEMLRRALRMCAVVAFVGGLLHQVDVGGGMMLLQLVGTILSLAGVFVMWGELSYFRRFSDRIPDDKLRRSTTMLMWIAPITLLLGILVGVGAVLLAGGPATTTTTGGTTITAAAMGPGPAAGIAIGSCFFVAFGAYLFLWYVRILVKYRKAFREALAFARAATPVQAL